MSEAVMETQCTTCSHREVCSFKDEYLMVQDRINSMRIYSDNQDGSHNMTPLSSFKWLKPIKIDCKYYNIVLTVSRNDTLSTSDTATYNPYKYAIECEADLDMRLRGGE